MGGENTEELIAQGERAARNIRGCAEEKETLPTIPAIDASHKASLVRGAFGVSAPACPANFLQISQRLLTQSGPVVNKIGSGEEVLL
jgi:hypothetical protein